MSPTCTGASTGAQRRRTPRARRGARDRARRRSRGRLRAGPLHRARHATRCRRRAAAATTATTRRTYAGDGRRPRRLRRGLPRRRDAARVRARPPTRASGSSCARPPLGDAESEPCAIDGLVRVGHRRRRPHRRRDRRDGAGQRELRHRRRRGRSPDVGRRRARRRARSRRPSRTDRSTRPRPSDGVAVLAAYADEGQAAIDLVDDVIEVTGLPGARSTEGQPRGRPRRRHRRVRSGAPPVEPPPVTMPEPG